MSDSDFPTVIGPDANFKGQLSFEKGVKVLGTFEGQINTNGELELAPGSHVQADVEAGSISVEGDVKGNIAASELVELKQTAKLQGDIRCARLIVIDGASFVGHCNVGDGAVKKPDITEKTTVRSEPAKKSEPDDT